MKRKNATTQQRNSFAFASTAALALLIGMTIISFSREAASQTDPTVLAPPPPPAIADPDVKTDRLCAEAADPEAAPDKVHINCRLEYGEFAPKNPPAPATDTILVVAYNIERGMKLEKQIDLLTNNPDMGHPDVIFVSEADRGCSRTNYRNIARELARALGMNYVFGVEYIELPRKSKRPVDNNETTCEHGNAVLSRFPILRVAQMRHEKTSYWYIPPGPKRENAEPRLGGCMSVFADLDTGGAPLRVYQMHFDSGTDMALVRASQARELIDHSKTAPGAVIMGGDMNVYAYLRDVQAGSRTDPATSEFLNNGWADAHSSLRAKERSTIGRSYPFPAIIDLIFMHGAEPVRSGVCPLELCDALSDHLPIWTRVKLTARNR